MKTIQPKQPNHLSPYAKACLEALVNANLADCISLGGAFGFFHYFDYRPTHDVVAWWSETVTNAEKKDVIASFNTVYNQTLLKEFVSLIR